MLAGVHGSFDDVQNARPHALGIYAAPGAQELPFYLIQLCGQAKEPLHVASQYLGESEELLDRKRLAEALIVTISCYPALVSPSFSPTSL